MRRLTYLLGLSAALHLYIGVRIIAPLPGAWLAVLFALLLVASGIAGADGHALAAPRPTAAVGYAGLGRPAVPGPVLVAVRLDGSARRPASAGLAREPDRPAEPAPGEPAHPHSRGRTPAGHSGDLHRVPERAANGPGENGGDSTGRAAGGTARLHHRADQRRPRRADHPGALCRSNRGSREPARARPDRHHRRPGRWFRA